MDLEIRIPARHPLRLIRGLVNEVLEALSVEFERLYSHAGQPSIRPAKTRFRGRRRVEASFTLALAAYNLVRLPKLLEEAPA